MVKLITILCTVAVLSLTSAANGKLQTTDDGSEFYYIEPADKYTWFEALGECSRMNMSLVAIDSENKSKQIDELLENLKVNLWIGGHDHAAKKSFVWVATGQTFSYSNWAKGEANKDEHCVEIKSENGYWNGETCTSKRGFICEEHPMLKQAKSEYNLLWETHETFAETMNQTELTTQAKISEQEEEILKLKKDMEVLKNSCKDQEEFNDLQMRYEQQSHQLREQSEDLEFLRKSTETTLVKKRDQEIETLKRDQISLQERYRELNETMATQENKIMHLNTKKEECVYDKGILEDHRVYYLKLSEHLNATVNSEKLQKTTLEKNIKDLTTLNEKQEVELKKWRKTTETTVIKEKNEEIMRWRRNSTNLEQRYRELNETMNIQKLEAKKKCSAELNTLKKTCSNQSEQSEWKLQQSTDASLLKNATEELELLKTYSKTLEQRCREVNETMITQKLEAKKKYSAELNALKKTCSNQTEQLQEEWKLQQSTDASLLKNTTEELKLLKTHLTTCEQRYKELNATMNIQKLEANKKYSEELNSLKKTYSNQSEQLREEWKLQQSTDASLLKNATEELELLKTYSTTLEQRCRGLNETMITQKLEAKKKYSAELNTLKKSCSNQFEQLQEECKLQQSTDARLLTETTEELELWKKSSDMCEQKYKQLAADRLKQQQQELELLQKSTETSLPGKKTEELGALKQSSAKHRSNCEKLDASTNHAVQKSSADRLKQMQQELDLMQKFSVEEVNLLKQRNEELDALKNQFNGNQVTCEQSVETALMPINCVTEENEDCGSSKKSNECDQTLNESSEELETLEVKSRKSCALEVKSHRSCPNNANKMLMKQMYAERSRLMDVLINSFQTK